MNLVNMIVFESMRPKLAKRKVAKINPYFFYPQIGGGHDPLAPPPGYATGMRQAVNDPL